MSETNILIVGAGPTGLAAALELARRGCKPRIIDKGSDFTPVERSQALAVNNRTLQLLTPSGVTDRLLAIGNKVEKFRVVNEQGRSVIRFDYTNAGALYPFMLVVPQGKTERVLAEALEEYGVKIEENKEVIASNGDATRPSVDVNTVDGIETIKADIIIGADGSGSAVRKEFGFSFDGEGYPVEFGLADLTLADPIDESEAVVSFGKKGTFGTIPMGGGVVRVVSPRPDISAALPEDLRINNVIWRSAFNISFRHVQTMQRGAVFLAGDAAHVHSPAGGRGMNLGIEDACWLAWLIDQNKTDGYSDLRLPEVRKVIAFTKTQTEGLVRMNGGARFVRDHFVNRLLKVKSFKRSALSRITGLDTADPPWL